MKATNFLLKLLSLVLSFSFAVYTVEQAKTLINTPTFSLKPTQYTQCADTSIEIRGCKFGHGTTDSSFLQLVDQGDVEWVKLTLSKGANVNERDKKNLTGLIIAAKCSNIEMAKVLIDAGADIDLQDSYGRTALIYAVTRKNKEFINLLLTNKANINTPDSFGMTPLMYAAGSGATDIVEKLLSNGAKLVGKAKNGWTIANFAEGHNDTAKLLKQYGIE